MRFDWQLWNFNIENESVVLWSVLSQAPTFPQMGF
jgi:hypothetical protein